MLFRNKSDDDRDLAQGGVKVVTVPQGETHVVTAEEAAGIVLQCGPDGAWEPADDEAVAAVAEATKPPEDDDQGDDELSATDPTEPTPTPARKPRARTSKGS